MNHSLRKRTFNPLAAGSIPARPTRENKGFRYLRPEALFSFLAKLRHFEQICAQKAYIVLLLPILICLMTGIPAHAQPIGWDFYFFGVNTKTFKEADWKMVALGAATSVAVHTAGHYAYAWANGMSVKQDGFREIISFNENSAREIRQFAQAGFVAQHFVGLVLTTIPATRQTDFTRGYVAMAWMETVTYPLLHPDDGDLYLSHHFGGNRDWEYAAYMAVATHNVLRVKWYRD